MASTSGSTMRAISKTALRSGSSKQGKAPAGVHRLELGGGHGLGLAVGTGVGGAVEAAQLVVEGAGEAAGDAARARAAAGPTGRKITCSRSSSKRTVQADRAAVGGPDLDVAHGELGRVHHDHVDGLVDHARRSARVPEKVADATFGLDLDVVGLRLDRPGQAKRLRAIPAG